MLRTFTPDPVALPPSAPPEGDRPVVDRIRAIPGVLSLDWSGDGPVSASARHCGERHVVAAPTLHDALLRLERELRERNRAIVREAFRLL